MKIDDKGRAFFNSIETLERIDQLIEAADAYVRDRAPIVLGAIAAAVRSAVPKSLVNRWRFVTDRVGPTRYIGLSLTPGDLVRVHFGYNKKQEYVEFFPGTAWVGIWAVPALDFHAIAVATQDMFSKPITNDTADGFPIFENLANWPDLREGGFADFYPLCSDNGKAVSEEIAAQIVAIVQALERVPECLSVKP